MDGCMPVITRFSITAPVPAAAPACVAAVTEATSPANATMYLPEQIVRAISSSTFAAFTAASCTTNPRATLESSINPMESNFAIAFLSSRLDRDGTIHRSHDAIDAAMNARPQRTRFWFGQQIPHAYAISHSYHRGSSSACMLLQRDSHLL